MAAITVGVPVYNEAESLEPLHAELSEVAAANGYELEILFVDDGSKDGSWGVIQKLAAKDGRVQKEVTEIVLTLDPAAVASVRASCSPRSRTLTCVSF